MAKARELSIDIATDDPAARRDMLVRCAMTSMNSKLVRAPQKACLPPWLSILPVAHLHACDSLPGLSSRALQCMLRAAHDTANDIAASRCTAVGPRACLACGRSRVEKRDGCRCRR